MTQNNTDIPQVTEQESGIDWIEILTVLWGSRKLIVSVTGSATAFSVAWFSDKLILCIANAVTVLKQGIDVEVRRQYV